MIRHLRVLGALAALAAPVALAHHSVAGQFDTAKVVAFSGVVRQVDWINPHSYLHVDVKDPKGQVVAWRIESLPVAMMRKAGLSKQALLANGEVVKFEVHPARDGTQHLAYMIRMTFADGRNFQFSRDPNGTATGG